MGSARVYKFNVPYAGADVGDLSYTQTTDTMYLAHLSYPPSKIVRAGSTSWTFQTLTFGSTQVPPTAPTATATTPNNGGSVGLYDVSAGYVVTAVATQTQVESVATAPVTVSNDLTLQGNINTISWTAPAGATSTTTYYNVYKTTVNGFYGFVGSTTNTTFTDDNIGPDYSQSPPQNVNPFATAGNYPSSVTLFQQRLFWARTTNAPNGLFSSRVGGADLENLNRSTPLRADDSIDTAIFSGQATNINSLTSTSYLLGLASDGVYVIDGDGNGGPIFANSGPSMRKQVGRGASRLPGIVADSVVFYCPAIGNSVRTLGFDYTVDGLKSNDVSIFSPHLFEGFLIVSWCYQREPRSIIWAVRNDGILLCFTWEEGQGVWGWTRCDTDGTVLSVCSISENAEDSVYLIVERVINGVTKTYVEQLASHLWTDVKQTCFVDCAVTATFTTPVSSVSGLWHLDGATNVAGIVDGVPVSGLTVTNGVVDLPASIGTGSVITLGLPFEVEVQTLPMRQTLPNIGSNIGRMQQAAQAVLTVLNTSNLSVGINSGQTFPWRPTDDQMWDNATGLFTGDSVVTLDNKAHNQVSLYINQTAAAPLTLLGVALDLDVTQ
jgi:hypothetical protein